MRRALSAFLPLVLFASACSLGPREEWAEAIHDAFTVAREQSSAKVRTANSVKAIETNIRQTQRPLVVRAEGVVDFGTLRATVVEKGERKARITFDDVGVYLPRSKASIAEDERRWSFLDFKRKPSENIDDNDRRTAVGAGILISPVLAVEILEGALTGSIERVGREKKAGAETTRYSARVAPDQAVRNVDDEDRRSGVLRVFESIGVTQDLFPLDVWIDDDGLVRGLRFVMRQQKDRVNAFELRTSWEFFDYGVAADVKIPDRADAVQAPRMRDLVVDFVRESVG